MSGIYIKGMEMPKEPLMMVLFPTGVIETEEYEIGHNAKAFAVPNHGRLVDADAFVNRLDDGKSRNDSEIRGARRVINQLFFAPTIIPADKGGDA